MIAGTIHQREENQKRLQLHVNYVVHLISGFISDHWSCESFIKVIPSSYSYCVQQHGPNIYQKLVMGWV